MFSDPKSLAERTPAAETEPMLDKPEDYRNATDAPSVTEADPEHTKFLYASTRRPLGMWFDLPVPYSLVGGTARSGVVGTSVPLTIPVLDKSELVPFDEKSRAASIVADWTNPENLSLDVSGDLSGREVLATAVGNTAGAMKEVRLLGISEGPGEKAIRRVIRESGFDHQFIYQAETAGGEDFPHLTRATMDLLSGEGRFIYPNIAMDQASRWFDGNIFASSIWPDVEDEKAVA
jgi:hypothetical protein